jgi:3-dehydroquinate synthase
MTDAQRLTQPHGLPTPRSASVAVGLGPNAYEIVIGHGLLSQSDRWPTACRGARACIVTNPVVWSLHGAAFEGALKQRFSVVDHVLWPEGETHKTWDGVQAIATHLLQQAADRSVTLVALGGGIVGDLTGFAAACYMRGVPYVQVPTTLLSQVDSSVGGKTGINHPLGKNMLGAFHQPIAVLCDLGVLHTLPAREVRAGVAEIIKVAAVADADFFAWLEGNLDALTALEPSALVHAVERSVALKAGVVATDEKERGRRAILNFGHTFGHAIEGALGYGQWLHGEAVGCGMVIAAHLSSRLGLTSPQQAQRVHNLVQRAGLPVVAPDLAWATWQHWMRVDKKALDGDIRYVLMSGIGDARVQAVPDAAVQAVLATLQPPHH